MQVYGVTNIERMSDFMDFDAEFNVYSVVKVTKQSVSLTRNGRKKRVNIKFSNGYDTVVETSQSGEESYFLNFDEAYRYAYNLFKAFMKDYDKVKLSLVNALNMAEVIRAEKEGRFVYKCPSRSNVDTYIVQDEFTSNWYYFYTWSYIRQGGTDDRIDFIDYDGGDMIGLGFTVNGKPVKKIEFDNGKQLYRLITDND